MSLPPELWQCPHLWRAHSPETHTSPRSKVAVFWSTWLLTTQVKLALGWLSGKLRVRVQGSEGGSSIILCSLGRPMLPQVTFRSSVSREAVHSRVALHQPGVMDVDLTRIWGRGAGSGRKETKRMGLTWLENISVCTFLSIMSLKPWHSPLNDSEHVLQIKHNLQN